MKTIKAALIGLGIGLIGIASITRIEGPQSQQTIGLDATVMIDSESQQNFDRGLSDIKMFAVGRKGQIYVLDAESKEHQIFLFDEKGTFIKAFGRKGQGPGEFQLADEMYIDNGGNLIVHDVNENKLVFFDGEGEYLKDIRTPSDWGQVIPLENGGYIATRGQMTNEKITTRLSLYDRDFREIKALDEVSKPNSYFSPKIEASYNPPTLAKGRNKI